MPNHIHVLWEQLKMNGKETPKASFEKYTGHIFLKQLKADKENLSGYASEQEDRNYLFWQRDPLVGVGFTITLPVIMTNVAQKPIFWLRELPLFINGFY